MTITFTTHVLNGTDGTHAGGVALRLCAGDAVLAQGVTDQGGRLRCEIAVDALPADGAVALHIETAAYWRDRSVPRQGPQIVEGVTIRLSLPPGAAHHHVPIMLSPNAFSAWWSA
ncbi:MAG: hydroxyisourate hydrolase [Rhodobacter sp.]|nr:hydroxyisourate hydrolase [Paracoccaceae bacterium]MCB1408362.1 hydroxyisourate hydrolase [Paracoccaceae bacterium]MCC0080375.1 hydroxyisourate hydrolase [Rhodobacter sp.]